MLIISSNTKKGKALLEVASLNEGKYLCDVYDRYSEEKRKAWQSCYRRCGREDGEGFHICTHNGYKFTVSWKTEKGVRIETATSSYLVN